MKKLNVAFSKRRFDLAGIESIPFALTNLCLEDILCDDGTELNRCIQEIEIDRILDLSINEIIQIRTSRDNDAFVGLIKRIK